MPRRKKSFRIRNLLLFNLVYVDFALKNAWFSCYGRKKKKKINFLRVLPIYISGKKLKLVISSPKYSNEQIFRTSPYLSTEVPFWTRSVRTILLRIKINISTKFADLRSWILFPHVNRSVIG